MSRNNLIAVTRRRGRYYVLARINADEQWDRAYCRRQIDANRVKRWKSSRADALVLAHDLQKKYETEYGVREV